MSQQYVGRVDLYTFKEGLLSRVAHDLKLSLGHFELTSADDGLTFVGWPDSIEVTGVMRGGRVYPDQLSGRDKNTNVGAANEGEESVESKRGVCRVHRSS